ncbi:hypothetical protein BFJ63_vAg16577 [Fusarium oxysporum f. sp. narcissi]|uniref:Amidohydrolase 3 domain-containing protein n=1 Tax=Fusarium oxysporum f. sp. narcissi TaxID=451672 RepID=A0A4Q2V2Y0_FUSOX|nr:hypothetical protein BFJ63_vAg16577 [Fusarium oxysporum f. sp. narcissi]
MYYNFDPFWSAIRDKIAPYIQPHLVPQGIIDSIADYNRKGITTIFESHAMEPDHIGVYKILREKGLLNARVMASSELEGNALPGCEPKSLSQIQETLEQALAATELKDDWLRVEGITTCVWGIPTCHGLHWKDGYVGPFGERTTGIRNLTEEKLQLAFDFCAKNGLRLNLLATSPDEIDEYIDKTEKVMKKYNVKKTGWLIEHAMIIREGQAKKFKELGFDITVNIGHTYGLGDLLEERVGPKALEGLNAIRELLDAGLTVGSCLDWGPMDPWECLQLSITHQMFPSGRLNNGKRQVITQAEALDTFTEQAAAVMRWERLGALKPGYHADLIIVDRNPITCDVGALAETKVLRTTVGGRIVWDNGEISGER